MQKILLVDDSKILRDQLKETLAPAGLEIIEASDGVQGLELIQANTDIRLIISDFNMPRMDGISMCVEAGRCAHWKNITVIMLTTETARDLKDRGKQAGVRAWVTKPHDPEQLRTTVLKLLQREGK